jgi:hypothetical protein
MRPFLVCIHDATPAHAGETRTMIGELAPLIGPRLSFGVVPDWHGEWPLTAHPDYCRLLRESSEDLLLHGYFHRRRRGSGPVTLLADGCDEMNGLDAEETREMIERGQRMFAEAFGQRARGFVAPAWQRGQVRLRSGHVLGVDHVLGFFSLRSQTGRTVPLATWTWDCGRWPWLGHVGHGLGRLLQSLDGRVPTLAIHPRDLERGYWPRIIQVIEALVRTGHEPVSAARLLEEK